MILSFMFAMSALCLFLSSLGFSRDHSQLAYKMYWPQHSGNMWLIPLKVLAAALAATSYPTGGSAEPLAKGGPRAKRGLG